MVGTDSHAATEFGGHCRPSERGAAPRRAYGGAGFVQIFPRALDAAARVFRVRADVTIGTSDDVPIQLADRRVSRRHARAEPVQGGFSITDLDSRHGTFVAGAPAGKSPVRAAFGDVVRVGDTLLLAVSELDPYASPPRRIPAASLAMRDDILAGPSFCQILDHAARVAGLGQPVLLLGESGSGKEIVARSVHGARRTPGPFVGLNISAIPETLFESELFGHERGAFTGAVDARPGAFREANAGVLFLDEVADLRVDLQVKLLRVIDTQAVRPLGGRHDSPIDVQVVAATSQDLHAACGRSEFRHDLYYRLAGVILRIPPLRERRDEILLLAQAMLHRQAPALRLTAEVAEALAVASWHGNVRNLRRVMTHAISSAVAAGRSDLTAGDLPELDPLGKSDGEEKVTVESVRLAMARADGVASRAAALMGVSRSTFYNLCKRFGIPAGALRSR